MRVGLLGLVLLLGTGCLIDRSSLTGGRDTGAPGVDAPALDAPGLDAPGRDAPGLDAPGLDAPDLDAPRVDTGPGCVPLDCDDGNACTDDLCTSSGCTNTDRTGACDDGVLCNGGDTCSAGACSVHDGIDPCAPPTLCDAGRDVCVGCVDTADCPARMDGTLGPCRAPASDVCATRGVATQPFTTYACVDSVCQAAMGSEDVACRTDAEGTMCAPDERSDYGACGYADVCSLSGSRSRSFTSHACASGVCGSAMELEIDTAGCARATDGDACGAENAEAWSLCGGFSDTCDESGTRTRRVVIPVCTAGACGMRFRMETEACVRATTGLSCGGETCAMFGPCTRNDTNGCSSAGTHTRTCTMATCSAGTCSGAGMRTDSEACTAPILGESCVPAMDCTRCRSGGGSGVSCSPSGSTGMRFCSDADGASCTALGLCIDSTPVSETCVCP